MTAEQPGTSGRPPTFDDDTEKQQTVTQAETMVIEEDTQLENGEESRDIHVVMGPPGPVTSAQEGEVSTRFFKARQGQTTNKHGQETNWTGSASPSKDNT